MNFSGYTLKITLESKMDKFTAKSADKTDGLNGVTIRDVVKTDLPIFFRHQLDPAANFMAAFTVIDPADEAVFSKKWAKILDDKTVITKTILYDGGVAGHVASFERFGKPEVTYWIGKEYWGKGIATLALSLFLNDMKVRPIYARAAKDNAASIRVLEKCGFTISGYEKAYANARGEEIEEAILTLA